MATTVRIGAATVIRGDCLKVLPDLGQVDAIVTDPPYHLVDMHARAKRSFAGNRDGSMARLAAGFMGKAWDGGDVAFRPETWAAMLPVLKPGGYLLAFGGTRTHHRVWCAIEDAGFVIQDTIMWLYGQGFPKGRTQLKPAWEPICVAYKPGGPRTLQIDGCRVATNWTNDPTRRGWQGGATGLGSFNPGQGESRSVNGRKRNENLGRWPANVCHSGDDEVMAAFPIREVNRPSRQVSQRSTDHSGLYGPSSGPRLIQAYADTGTAARFFFCGKATKADRAGSNHPTVKPIALMRWLVRLVTPPGGLVLDPFAGSGTTGAAAMAEGRNPILIEREPEYFKDIKRRLRADQRKIPKAA